MAGTQATDVDNEFIWLSGAGANFLNSLPEFVLDTRQPRRTGRAKQTSPMSSTLAPALIGGISDAPPPARARTGRAAWLQRLALVAITLISFWPATHAGFIALDDGLFVTSNPHVLSGLSWNSLAWAFTDTSSGYYAPITWLSYLIDTTLWGHGPAGYHATNLALHAANVLLVYEIFRAATGAPWRSGMVAILFGIHPLRAEAVAWIAQRDHVLSAFFGLLSLRLYVAAALTTRRQGVWLALSWLAYALSLLAKPTLVLLGPALFLVDLWPLRRLQTAGRRRLILEKLPFFAGGFAMALLTMAAMHAKAANAMFPTPPLALRLANAAMSCLNYVVDLFELAWPGGSRLCILYPYPRQIATWKSASATFALIALALAAAFRWRREPRGIFGIGWFFLLVFPTLGIFSFSLPFARADRYTYLPHIGLIAALAFLDLTRGAIDRLGRTASIAIAMGITAILCLSTRAQCGLWKNDVTLFQNAVDHTTDNPLAQDALGSALADAGHPDAAMTHFERAIALEPRWIRPRFSLADAFMTTGRGDRAIDVYEQILRQKPDDAPTHANLGVLLAERGKPREALAHYRAAIQADPGNLVAYYNLGRLYGASGRPELARQCFYRCVWIDPAYQPARDALSKER